MKSRIILVIFMLLLLAPALQISAREQEINPALDLPEQAGVYNVPGRPGLKLRVFVYQAKNEKPGRPGSTTPEMICGSESALDPDSSSEVSPAGWKLPTTWSYNLNSASAPSNVGSTNLATIATNSFSAWQTQTGGTVTIERGLDASTTRAARDSQNIIAWGRTSGTALAVSYIWYLNGTALEIDTIFNKKFSWYWSDPDQWPVGQICAYSGVYDVQNILTHELGHTFGLDDEYANDYANNTMYGYGSKGETKKNTLTYGDIVGIDNIY